MARHGIRWTVTTVAGLVVGAVLITAAIGLVVLQRSTLVDTLDGALAGRADGIIALISEGGPPQQFAPGVGEGFVQLVDAEVGVIASTPNLQGEPPLALRFESQGDTIQQVSGLAVDDDVFRVLSRPVDGGVLHVGTTFDVVNESTTALVASLAITIPVVLLILAVVVWWLVGRTLRPVEDIRTKVSEIGSADLARRVPTPGTEDEIDRLAHTMNQMLERLESSVEREHRFVADASHELRSPLTRLRTELELGLAEARDEQDRRRLTSLLIEVRHMQATVEDLLYLARADAADSPVVLVELDLDDLVLEEARLVAGDGSVTLDLSGVSGAHVRSNRSGIRRAVANLLDNARRHARTRVDVTLQESGDWAVLRVSDDGPGIPASAAARVFDRFLRLDEARSRETGGTGLGLAIARQVAEQAGGSLHLVNPGQDGACFELRVPLAR